MKSISLLTLALVALTEAYPNIGAHVAQTAKAKRSTSVFEKVKDKFSKKSLAFSTSQLVDVSGDYAFVAPTDTDQRGPCPGLNALANHGYLPHDGVATIEQFITSTNEVFGMGLDLGTFLAVYGAVFDGDLTSWSIGGPTSDVPSVTSLLGTPQGISGSHNNYESDASPTRGDLYEYGNDYLVQVSQFQALYDAGKADDSYDIDVLTSFRATRFQQSIDNNPYFFYAPFSGIIVSPAAYTFIFRYMGNKSEEYPEGYLNGDVLKSFFAITGDDGDFTYTPGYERIPENWYTRNPLDPYGIVAFALDLNAAGLEYPQFLVPGGNLGTTDSYTGVNVDDLTGGLYSLDDLTDGDNALCLAYQLTIQALPDSLSGIFSSDTDPLDTLLGAFSTALGSLGCTQLEDIDEDQYFDAYPGYADLGSDGTYAGESAQ